MRRLDRRIAAVLATVLVANLLLPAWLMAASASDAATGARQVVLCTASGLQLVTLEQSPADGDRSEHGPAPALGHGCPLCIACPLCSGGGCESASPGFVTSPPHHGGRALVVRPVTLPPILPTPQARPPVRAPPVRAA
ncbi:MAG: hypothetical protein H6983_08600 [Ectothiorhodospiraceae bacterium]|nr:hypothetical protein [Chromatiales bacterium]MCP5154208.1 hypothetical protein [Ectothiorhodospiraceae bacterium]